MADVEANFEGDFLDALVVVIQILQRLSRMLHNRYVFCGRKRGDGIKHGLDAATNAPRLS